MKEYIGKECDDELPWENPKTTGKKSTANRNEPKM